MLTFWIIGTALTLLALAFVVPPLLKKNLRLADIDSNTINVAIYKERLAELEQEKLTPEQLALAKQELDKTLAQDLETSATPAAAQAPNRWAAIAVAISIPILVMGSYIKLGSPQLITASTATESHATQGAAGSSSDFEQMVQKLAERLEQQPEDLTGWQMLARSYAVMGNTTQAIQTYNKILSQFGEQSQILADYAELLAKTNQDQLAGMPTVLLKRAQELDPDNEKTLYLLGAAAMEKADPNTAIEHWQRLLTLLPEQAAEFKQVLQQHIATARRQLDPTSEPETVQAPESAPSSTDNTANKPAQIEVHVNLEPSLQAQVKPSDTLFIYARATKGSPMPLAIVRKTAGELPTSAILDDSMAMMPNMKLSSFKEVSVLARISRSGTAVPQSGDLLGQVSPVILGEKNQVTVTINETVP